MKRALFISLGAAVAALVTFLLGSLATNWYSEHLAKSDDEINTVVKVFLFLWPVPIALGALVGNILFKHKNTSDTSET